MYRALPFQDKLGEAAELCAAVLGSAPQNARAFYIRAAVLRKEGKGKEAVEAACEAARLRPDLPSAVLAAGSLLCREKSFACALELYEKALEEDPSNPQYHLGGERRCFKATGSKIVPVIYTRNTLVSWRYMETKIRVIVVQLCTVNKACIIHSCSARFPG